MTETPAVPERADAFIGASAARSRSTAQTANAVVKSPDTLEPYDPSEDQEQVRSNIAYWLIAALLFVIFCYCCVGLLAGGSCRDGGSCEAAAKSLALVREFMGVALASISGLVGAVTGFYFGAQTARKGGERGSSSAHHACKRHKYGLASVHGLFPAAEEIP